MPAKPITVPAINLTFTRRDWMIAILIILLAFGYRMVIIVDRATAPNEIAAFDPLPQGTDQLTYYNQLLRFEAGTFPPETFIYQPGLTYFLYASSQIIRTTNLGALRVFTAFLAALNCGVMIAVGRLVTGRRDTGIIAGLLLALYPVSAFYDTDFVITSQAVILATLALFGTLWLWRSPNQWTGTVLLGLSTGAAAVTRLEVAVLAPVCGLWLIAVRRDGRSVLQVLLAALLAVAVVAPVVIHNQRGGADYLISAAGPAEMYRGNNRDADGTRSPSNASDTTHDDYIEYLAKDIALEPVRFAELIVRKTALSLSNHEPGNNLNYTLQGEQISPALAWNPLDFSVLLAVSLFGLVMLFREQHRSSASLLLLASAGFTGMVLLVWVESRIRTPLIVMLIPAAAYGITHLIASLRGQPVRAVARQFIPVMACIGVLLLLISLAVQHLPRKLTVSSPPEGVTRTSFVYDGVLELVGWKTQEQYSPRNVISPFEPYVVTLYWRLLEPAAVDYSFALKYLVEGQQMVGIDRPIGTLIYPERTTRSWAPDTIYVDHIGMSYRRLDGPFEQTGILELTVYPERDFTSALPAIGTEGTEYASVIVGQPAIRDGSGRSRLEDAARQIAFGDVLLLNGWHLPAQADPGATVTVTTGWQTTHERMTASYAIALFLFRNGDYVTNIDSPPHAGQLLTLSIPARYSFDDVKMLRLPDEVGRYEVRVGVYDQATIERLPVVGEDNLYTMGTILVGDIDTP